jgi:hypothetical protein
MLVTLGMKSELKKVKGHSNVNVVIVQNKQTNKQIHEKRLFEVCLATGVQEIPFLPTVPLSLGFNQNHRQCNNNYCC